MRLVVAQRPKTKLATLLSVSDAARALGISRSLAYELAQRYEVSGGREGLPVIRLGARLRVPDWTLVELARTGRVVQLRDDGAAKSARGHAPPAKAPAAPSAGGRRRGGSARTPARRIGAEPLLAGGKPRSVKAFDLTFSAPKSVSLLWALGSDGVADTVMTAHREAVAAALRFLEERAALARQQVDGVRRHVPTEGWAAGG